MRINTNNNCSFNGRILTKDNHKLVNNLKERLENFQRNGIPIGDCFYKVPENTKISLKTNDKKYSAGISALGNNLFVRRIENQDFMTISIEPAKNVKYWEIGFAEIEDVKKDSPLADKINNFLREVLPKFF